MSDYISREAAIVRATKVLVDDFDAYNVKVSLQATPAADVVEVRHGRWINGRCSECGEHAPFWSMASTYHLSKYCPDCGAKMDGGQDE